MYDISYSTLIDMFNTSVKLYANNPAMQSFGTRQSYKELGITAKNVASWLQAQGIQQGDRIAIMSPNVLAYPSILFGVLLVGGVVVNVNPLYTATELAHQINDAGTRFIFVFENFANTVETALPNTNIEKVIIVRPGDLLGLKGKLINVVSKYINKSVPTVKIPNLIQFATLIKEGSTNEFYPVEITGDNTAFLQYTGGTTGVSKAAVLSHKNVAANIAQSWEWLKPRVESTGPHVMVTALPLYHIFGLTACCLLLVKIGGCCLLIANPRDTKGFVHTLKKSHFTLFSGVNTLYAALVDHPDISSVNFSNLVLSVAGGMSTQSVVAKKWKDVTGCAILEGYGLSETSPVLTLNRPDIEEFTGGIGYPIPLTEIVLRSNDKDVQQGEPGELLARGPQVMLGYWQRPDETAQAMTKDGFFKTGDIAVQEADGMFKIVDRLKDMIIVSGFNVYPNEVEEVLSQHPKVKEVAVIAVPDPTSGETPLAVVVARDTTLTAQELKEFARQKLTHYKVPRRYEFRDSLPKTNVGKILRRTLKEEYTS